MLLRELAVAIETIVLGKEGEIREEERQGIKGVEGGEGERRSDGDEGFSSRRRRTRSRGGKSDGGGGGGEEGEELMQRVLDIVQHVLKVGHWKSDALLKHGLSRF